MANVFISHRKADAPQVTRLATAIQAVGHRVWFDEWEITIGDSIVERVNAGLEGTHYLVLCCSAAGSSPWVDREWMATLMRQLNGHRVKLLPVLLDEAGRLPAIIADLRYANLAADWERGLADLLRAIR